MPAPAADLPPITALLFGLCGDLVDFGARTLPLALQRSIPQATPESVAAAAGQAPLQALASLLGRTPDADEAYAFRQRLCEAAAEQAQALPEATMTLRRLRQQGIPCAWLDELPGEALGHLAGGVEGDIHGSRTDAARPWPAPDACWQALIELGSPQLQGCVLISSQPRLLQSGLNAGLWTIGLAASGAFCGHSAQQWALLTTAQREQRRAQATLELYRIGVHSVIDHLGELESCLHDIACRRDKGEKP